MSDNVAHAIAGAGGGIISMAVTYPMIVVNSRIQANKNNNINKENYTSTTDAFYKISSKDGLRALYSGFKSGAFGITVTNSVYYYCYESLKSTFSNGNRKQLTIKQSMLSSLLAGTAVVLTTHPIWTVNTKVSFQKRLSPSKKHPSTFQMLLYTLRREGFLGLYAGSKTAMILIVNPIIQYTIFEDLKSRLYKGNLKTLDYFLLGAFSKLCASVIMYPYICMKSHFKANPGLDKIEFIKTIIKTEGIQGLYKGMSSKLVQSVLSSGILFCTKEVLFHWVIRLFALLSSRKHK